MFKPLTLSILSALALLSAPLAASAQEAAVTAKPAPAGEAYYIVTRGDIYRKCPYPMCGGYYVKAVNQALTRCTDGSLQKECHAVELNTQALGWSEAQLASFNEQFSQGFALVRATLAPEPRGVYTADVLQVSQAWQGQAQRKPLGQFYAVKDTGIRCITVPCPSLAATKLNTTQHPSHPELDLSYSGATTQEIQAGRDALYSTGILAAGVIVPTKVAGPAGQPVKSSKLLASEFYLPAQP